MFELEFTAFLSMTERLDRHARVTKVGSVLRFQHLSFSNDDNIIHSKPTRFLPVSHEPFFPETSELFYLFPPIKIITYHASARNQKPVAVFISVSLSMLRCLVEE